VSSRILVVDDDEEMAAMLVESLARLGHRIDTASSGAAALERLQAADYDAVVTDLRMRELDGIQLCDRIVTNFPDVPVILMTAFGTVDAAVAAIRAGAADFLAKPFKPSALAVVLERVLARRRLEAEVRHLRQRLEDVRPIPELIGESQVMLDLCQVLTRVAATDASVLITGETGSGKELVARALHARSARAGKRFVAFNCAAVPESLMESELFGHARGAFTDARAARPGLFQEAAGGTVFLDELGDMPLALQAKLLRALQERSVRPVGSDREVPIDVRILSATHQDLERAIEDGRFRRDLFYRLDVVHLDVPPLRARGNDVLLLAQRFVARFAAQHGKPITGLSSEVAARLLAYDWPGNVRELANCIERAVALGQHDQLIVEDLPPKLRTYEAPPHRPEGCDEPADLVSLATVERRHILRVLAAVAGNKARAARILEMDRKTLYRRLEEYGVAPADEERASDA
jgi:DNA-binding NtrC family response regulator